MKRIITFALALILTFLLGVYYTIKTVQPSYDDGFYILTIWGQDWCYADEEYLDCDTYEWQPGQWYED